MINALFLVLLHQLHLRSSSIRSQKLGTPAPIPISAANLLFPLFDPLKGEALKQNIFFQIAFNDYQEEFCVSSHRVPTLRNMNFGFPSLDRKRNMFILPNESPHSENRQMCLAQAITKKLRLSCCVLFYIFMF